MSTGEGVVAVLFTSEGTITVRLAPHVHRRLCCPPLLIYFTFYFTLFILRAEWPQTEMSIYDPVCRLLSVRYDTIWYIYVRSKADGRASLI